ncbi:very-long-chain 3-oxoacyl-CoA reductase-like [Ptychodera flava]|uniref:very-long-chain 3-oxoacyl-CoA reductase-like n=1 Tax=Ptychodera flava TaxID=63121 RepID=UPI003969FC89
MSLDIGSSLGRLQPLFTIAGLVSVSYVTLKVAFCTLNFVKVFVLSPLLKLHVDVKKLGQWAAVTGCTDGIGKAYAEELASKGLNIVLLSRSQEKLERVAKEIEANYNVQTKIIVVDFAQGPGVYENIEKEMAGLEVGVLVNNVGMASVVEYFAETADLEQYITNIINVNILAATQMTRIVLPAMVEKRKGVIMNISSASGKVPTGLLSVYSATKAYMDFFSRALHTEYESKGITVQSVMPYFVSTNMTRNMRTSITVPNSKQYVKQALATVGVENRTHGYYSHALQGLIFDILPTWLSMKLVFSELKKTRARVLKKKAGGKKTH